MPKIPFVPSQGQIDPSTPAISASPGAFAAPYQALEQAGRQTQSTALEVLRVQRALTAEQAKVDIEERLSALRVQYAEGLDRMQAEGVRGKDYADRATQMFADLRRQQEGALLYPEAIGLYRRKSRLLGDEAGIKALHRGRALIQGETLAGATLELEEKSNGAVYGATTAERQRAYGDGLDRIDSLHASGVISGSVFASMLKGYQRDIILGGIERDARDPVLLPKVLATLDAGGYAHLTPKEQATLGDGIRREQVQREEQAAARLEKQAEADRQNYLADLEVRIDTAKTSGGDLTVFRREIAQQVELRRLKPADVRTLYTLLDSTREAASDPEVLLRVSPDVHGTAPTFTEANIRALMAAHAQGQRGLSLKDGTALIDRLRQDSQRREDKALTEVKDEYARAYNQLRLSLGFSSPLDFGSSDQAKRLLYNATREFDAANARTNPNSKQGPWDALAQVLPKYQAVQTGDARMTLTDSTKAVDKKYMPFPVPDFEDEKAFSAWAAQTAKHLDAMPEKLTDNRAWKVQTDRFQQIVKQQQELLTAKARQATSSPLWKGGAGTQRKPGQATAGTVNE